MSDLQQLFQEFADLYRREGSADPRGYLAQVEGTDREELRVLIEAFLERAPRRAWDAEGFSGSMAERATARAAQEPPAEDVPAGGWPEALPALRHRARLKRSQVVERLAGALGFAGSEQRVAAYYHRMEQGSLAPSGVSTRVLEALGGIVGASAESLRLAGEAGETAGGAGGEVFARVGEPSGAVVPRDSPGVEADAAERTADELDRLFTGGG